MCVSMYLCKIYTYYSGYGLSMSDSHDPYPFYRIFKKAIQILSNIHSDKYTQNSDSNMERIWIFEPLFTPLDFTNVPCQLDYCTRLLFIFKMLFFFANKILGLPTLHAKV